MGAYESGGVVGEALTTVIIPIILGLWLGNKLLKLYKKKKKDGRKNNNSNK